MNRFLKYSCLIIFFIVDKSIVHTKLLTCLCYLSMLFVEIAVPVGYVVAVIGACLEHQLHVGTRRNERLQKQIFIIILLLIIYYCLNI